MKASSIAGEPVINLASSPLGECACLIKWLEDKILAALILLFISPVMAMVALAVKLTSPGPVFFIQDRHGLGGRIIRVYKFRSMRAAVSAPNTPAGGNANGCESAEPEFVQARAGDERITPIGRFLRRTSLDELPQFLNVLKGEMSIVGPRPHPLKLNRTFSTDVEQLMRRHYVKPGITGLAQVSGARGETRSVDDMRRRVDLDLRYILDWSLWLDLKLIALTVMKGFLNHQP